MAQLKTYCEIFSGYSFRNHLSEGENLDIGVLQLKDSDSTNNEFNYALVSTASKFTGPEKYYLKDKDVLIIARGNSNGAIQFEGDKCIRPTIASAAFLVIRPMLKYVDSGYLTWYLNLPNSQLYFRRSQVGTTVRNLSIGTLQEFDLKIPPLPKQQLIGKLYFLTQQDKIISRKREEKLTQLINEQVKNIL